MLSFLTRVAAFVTELAFRKYVDMADDTKPAPVHPGVKAAGAAGIIALLLSIRTDIAPLLPEFTRTQIEPQEKLANDAKQQIEDPTNEIAAPNQIPAESTLADQVTPKAGATYHLCIACPTDAVVIIDGRRTFATGKIREFDIPLPPTATHDLSVVVLQNDTDILLNDTTKVTNGARTIVIPAPKELAKLTAAELKLHKDKETAQRIRELENRNKQLRDQQANLLSGK